MNIDKMLEYQKLDSEKYKIEKQLKENNNQKMSEQMQEKKQSAINHSVMLEEKAESLFADIEKVKKQFKTQEDKMNEFLAKDLSKMSKEEVEKLTNLTNKLAQNLQILGKNLSTLATNVNAVLLDFNNTRNVFKQAKEGEDKYQLAYEQDLKDVSGKKNEIEKKLEVVAKECDPKLLEAYLKKRKENVFPVLVPLQGNSCGGCHVEMPYISISKIDDAGVLVCEHCRRINYKPKA